MNFYDILEIIPVLLIGLFSGLASLAANSEDDIKTSTKKALKVVYISTFMCLITYFILSSTDLIYYAKVGISAAVGFLGFEKSFEVISKILNIRK